MAMRSLRVLVLGGTTEGSALTAALARDDRFAAVLSLAGRTQAPVLPPGEHRIGGFGGIDGLIAYLAEHRTEAVVDATHPFAAQMTRHAAAATGITGTGLLRVDRPAWQRGPGDRWIEVADMGGAVAALGPTPRRVLLTIGQRDLAPFAAAPWHNYLIRSVDLPSGPPPGARLIAARGPFAEPDERRLLAAERIEMLVTKNAGGSATGAKLAAARTLGVTVVMVRRPATPVLATVPDVAGALAWLRHQAALRGV